MKNESPSGMDDIITLLGFYCVIWIISREKLEAFLLHAMEVGLISDGVLAQDINQASSFWRVREVLNDASISVPILFTVNFKLKISRSANSYFLTIILIPGPMFY